MRPTLSKRSRDDGGRRHRSGNDDGFREGYRQPTAVEQAPAPAPQPTTASEPAPAEEPEPAPVPAPTIADAEP